MSGRGDDVAAAEAHQTRPTTASRREAEAILPGGVPVNLDAIVRGLRSSKRGRAALLRRGITP